MPLIGADVEALEALAKNVQAKAEQIGSIGSELDKAVQGVSWVGRDADTFRNQWAAVSKSLLNVREQLRTHADTIKRNADEQRTTSAR